MKKPIVPRPASVPPPSALAAAIRPPEAASAPKIPLPDPVPRPGPLDLPAMPAPAERAEPGEPRRESRPVPAPLPIPKTDAFPAVTPAPAAPGPPLALLVGGGVVLVLVALGAWFFLHSEPEPAPVSLPAVLPPAVIDTGMPDAPTPPSAAELEAMLEELEAARESREYPHLQELAEAFLEREPHHARAAYLLSLALFRQAQPDEALPWAERAMEWDPEEGEYRLLAGDIHANRGRFPRARRIWADCARDVPLYGPCARRVEEHGVP